MLFEGISVGFDEGFSYCGNPMEAQTWPYNPRILGCISRTLLKTRDFFIRFLHRDFMGSGFVFRVLVWFFLGGLA